MSDLTLADLIEANRCDDIDGTAEAVSGALRLTKLQHGVLYPLIRDAVRMEWRNETRGAEPRPGVWRRVNPARERSAWLDKRIALGDGRYVLWEEATPADLALRLEMLEGKARGLAATIDFCRRVFKELENARAERVKDLPAPVLRALEQDDPGEDPS